MSARAVRRRGEGARHGESPTQVPQHPLVKTAHPLVFEAAQRPGDELFRRIQGVGLKYSGDVFVLDVSDPEKFKELTRHYKYVQGHFLIRRSEI